MFNGDSAFSNGNSFCLGMDDGQALTLPVLFRCQVPGYLASLCQ